MKYATAALVAFAAAANAQGPFEIGANGAITCTGPNLNGNYCASNSLGSPIIIRCTDGVGQAGNCNDNLAGQPPFELFYGECYQSSTTAGDAACEKNCVVYPDSTFGSPFTLPSSLCTPVVFSTSSAAKPTNSSTNSGPTSSGSIFQPTITSTVALPTGPTTTTSTGTKVLTSSGVTVTQTFTTTFCPESTFSTVIQPSGTGIISYPGSNNTTGGSGSSGSGSGSGSNSGSGSSAAATSGTGNSPTGSGNGGASNGTVTTAAGNGGSGGAGSSPTAIPVSPKTTAPVPFTGDAITNSASGALIVVALSFAYFL